MIKSSQFGFSLIEVMVSFLILGVGLLGMGTMVSNGIQMNQTAHLRTASIVLAQDMADKIRANRSADYISIPNPSITASCSLTSSATTITACGSLAETDVARWNQSLSQLLPGGVGVICSDDTPMDGNNPAAPACDGGDATAIKIWWVDNNQTENGTAIAAATWQRYVSVIR